jgi:hypothetical protein
VTSTARLVTIETPAWTPESWPRAEDWIPIVTGYVVVVPLVARIPMDVTFPLTVELVESGVTSASWPVDTSLMSATGMSVLTE